MYITAKTLDDLLMEVLQKLLSSKDSVNPTRGKMVEELGVLLKLRNPRARVSRTEIKGTIFSCVGELLWYLAKTNSLKFIEYYIPEYKKDSEDKRTIYGGYGPRLFSMRGVDQIANILALLRKERATKRAVIQLFDAADIEGGRRLEIPCTCTLQFLVRKQKLHLFVNMRSNDAFWGLPHDIFAFTMLQEMVARDLDVDLGYYKHFVGSLHLYERHIEGAKKYVLEGWQRTVPMPSMPIGKPWKAVADVLSGEGAIRKGRNVEKLISRLPPYWADFVRLLQFYGHSKRNEYNEMQKIKARMHSTVFNTYIQKRLRRKALEKPIETQPQLPYFAHDGRGS